MTQEAHGISPSSGEQNVPSVLWKSCRLNAAVREKKKDILTCSLGPAANIRGFCRAPSNYLEMERDCDKAERLLIEVTARPEHCPPVSSPILWTDHRKAGNDGKIKAELLVPLRFRESSIGQQIQLNLFNRGGTFVFVFLAFWASFFFLTSRGLTSLARRRYGKGAPRQKSL